MLAYALKLTRDPGSVGEDDVAGLREAGFEDAAIHDICQVTSYYNFVNRVANGLGVELEGHWKEEDLVLTRDEMDDRPRAR